MRRELIDANGGHFQKEMTQLTEDGNTVYYIVDCSY